MAKMVKTEEVLEELGFLSDRISTQVRTVAFGLLVIIWGLLIGKFKVETAGNLKTQLMIIGGIAIVTMFFDFAQYFFGYRNAKALLEEMRRENKQEGEYDYKARAYKWRDRLFWIKQISLTVAVVWFIVILICFVVSQL